MVERNRLQTRCLGGKSLRCSGELAAASAAEEPFAAASAALTPSLAIRKPRDSSAGLPRAEALARPQDLAASQALLAARLETAYLRSDRLPARRPAPLSRLLSAQSHLPSFPPSTFSCGLEPSSLAPLRREETNSFRKKKPGLAAAQSSFSVRGRCQGLSLPAEAPRQCEAPLCRLVHGRDRFPRGCIPARIPQAFQKTRAAAFRRFRLAVSDRLCLFLRSSSRRARVPRLSRCQTTAARTRRSFLASEAKYRPEGLPASPGESAKKPPASARQACRPRREAARSAAQDLFRGRRQ
ncbi:hypothetical protein TGPRC2_275990B [Toxoplasma gondii TgCatPRC2]|uniref:Uncharacterized protein n=1 Tax=Toxoplasma gondii TgCatPRC2 TaxID=1130821 RepID=A0A151H0K6_TOXGO|nr:hypothetical protein TGPRC2_275990B [Toxoplasma gondii TgCatPRC2]